MLIQYNGAGSLISSNIRVPHKLTHNPKSPSPLRVVQVSCTTRPTTTTTTTTENNNNTNNNMISSSSVTDTTIPITTTVYKDNWFDRIAIKHVSQSIQRVTGTSLSLSLPPSLYAIDHGAHAETNFSWVGLENWSL